MTPPAPKPRFFHRSLALLVDWAVVAIIASVWFAWALPWLKVHEDDLPWPLSGVLPWALKLAPVVFALILMLLRDLGRWRRTLGMSLLRLGVQDGKGGVPHRGQMLVRRLASVLSWLTLGLGFLPAIFGKRALQDRMSDTRVVRRGPARPWLAVLVIAAGSLSAWGSVRWLHREPTKEVWCWGYMDRTGRVVIEPRFQAAKPFRDGLALVRREGQWHWLDEGGHLLAKLGAFETYITHVQGVAIFQDQRIRTTCIDLNGQELAQEMGEVFPPLEAGQPFAYKDLGGGATFRRADGSALTKEIFEDTWPFHDGLGRFKSNGKVGGLDTEGNVVIPPAFDQIDPFYQGLAPARLDKLWGVLNREGNWVVEPRFQELGSLDKEGFGLLAAKLENRWGYLHPNGTWAIPPSFDLAKGFTKGGWARVKVGERWGVIDTQGAWVLEPRYEEVAPPREAPFAFRQGLRWGYLAPGGRVVVAPVFSQAGGFRSGCAFAKGLNRWFRVEASGHLEPLPLGWILDEDRPALEHEQIPFAQRQWKQL